MSSHQVGSNIPTDDCDSDSSDDELALQDWMNGTNIPTSTSKKAFAGSSRRLTGKQIKSSLGTKMLLAKIL